MAMNLMGAGGIDVLAAQYAQRYPTIDPTAALQMQAGAADPSVQIPNGGWNAPMTNEQPARAPINWNEMLKLAQAGISPLTPRYQAFAPGSSNSAGGPQGKMLLAPPGVSANPVRQSFADLLARIGR